MDPSCFYACGLCELAAASEEAPGAERVPRPQPVRARRRRGARAPHARARGGQLRRPAAAPRAGHVTLGNAMHTASMEHSLVERQCAPSSRTECLARARASCERREARVAALARTPRGHPCLTRPTATRTRTSACCSATARRARQRAHRSPPFWQCARARARGLYSRLRGGGGGGVRAPARSFLSAPGIRRGRAALAARRSRSPRARRGRHRARERRRVGAQTTSGSSSRRAAPPTRARARARERGGLERETRPLTSPSPPPPPPSGPPPRVALRTCTKIT